MVSDSCFHLHFPDNTGLSASFPMLGYHLNVLSGEVSAQLFGPFFLK